MPAPSPNARSSRLTIVAAWPAKQAWSRIRVFGVICPSFNGLSTPSCSACCSSSVVTFSFLSELLSGNDSSPVPLPWVTSEISSIG